MVDFDLSSIQKDPSGPWGNYDFDKLSLVAVAYNGNVGSVLWGVGGHIRSEMEEAGLSHLDDLGLHPPAPGVWIWEGRYVWYPGSYENPQDGSSETEGNWRAPTEVEWAAIKEGRCPWDDEEWKLGK